MGSDKISVQNERKPRAKQGHVLSTFVGLVHPGAVQNQTRGTRIRRGFLCINAQAEQKGIEFCRVGHSPSIEAVHDCHYCKWVDLNKRVSHSVPVRVLRFIRDSAYFAKRLRQSCLFGKLCDDHRVFLQVDGRSGTTFFCKAGEKGAMLECVSHIRACPPLHSRTVLVQCTLC